MSRSLSTRCVPSWQPLQAQPMPSCDHPLSAPGTCASLMKFKRDVSRLRSDKRHQFLWRNQKKCYTLRFGAAFPDFREGTLCTMPQRGSILKVSAAEHEQSRKERGPCGWGLSFHVPSKTSQQVTGRWRDQDMQSFKHDTRLPSHLHSFFPDGGESAEAHCVPFTNLQGYFP